MMDKNAKSPLPVNRKRALKFVLFELFTVRNQFTRLNSFVITTHFVQINS